MLFQKRLCYDFKRNQKENQGIEKEADLSACMVDLLPDLGIAKDAMGLAITAGYIAYAVGMSINSLLTDRTNPRLMICAAMFCCAATHLGIRLLPYLPVMIVLWCVNGYAQSAVWPSIVRLTADNLPAEQQESAMRIVSLFQQAGSLSCFLIAPAELALGGWRTAMSVTAAACFGWLADNGEQRPVSSMGGWRT